MSKGEMPLSVAFSPVLSRIADDRIISPPGQLQADQSKSTAESLGGELPKSHPWKQRQICLTGLPYIYSLVFQAHNYCFLVSTTRRAGTGPELHVTAGTTLLAKPQLQLLRFCSRVTSLP